MKRDRERDAVRLAGDVGLDELIAWPAAGRKPRRVQLSRRRGWRLPPGAVVVAQPSRFGNPYRRRDADRAEAVAWYLEYLEDDEELLDLVRQELRGRDLACWCPHDQPCHADVLLLAANEPGPYIARTAAKRLVYPLPEVL